MRFLDSRPAFCAGNHSLCLKRMGTRACPARQYRPCVKTNATLPQSRFYDRPGVVPLLKSSLETGCRLILLDGPFSCGKTAALREAIRLANLKPEASGAKLKFLHIDLRGPPGNTPEGVVARIMDQLRETGMLKDLLGDEEFKTNFPFIEDDTWFSEPPLSLDLLLTMLHEMIATAGGSGRPIPVLVFDEANKMYDWRDPQAVRMLTSYFLKTGKQDRVCNSVVATRDPYLLYYLEANGVNPGTYETLSMGNMTKYEAEAFMFGDDSYPGQLAWYRQDSESFDLPGGAAGPTWQAVYNTCGGNPGLLLRVADSALTAHRADTLRPLAEVWEDALCTQRASATYQVLRGFLPETWRPRGQDKPLWTAEQWELVLRDIADHEHHAVPVFELLDRLDGKAVKSLVRFNQLAIRRECWLAKDLSDEVFVGLDSPEVITAASPAQQEYITSRKWEQDWAMLKAAAAESRRRFGDF